MKTKILIILITVLIFSSCKKKVAEVNADFVGEWYSESYFSYGGYEGESISIDEASYGVYEKLSLFRSVTVNGRTKLGKNNIRIGIKGFHINQFPEKVGDIGELWQMKLDGTTYYKYKEKSLLYNYSPYITFVNIGSETIEASINSEYFTLYSGEEYYFYRELGTNYEYSDNHNNHFSFPGLGCEERIEVE